MKTKIFILLLVLISIMAGCGSKKTASANPDVYYTCSMHPQVVSNAPGKCPICGMELIQASKIKTGAQEEIQLSDQQIQLANITYDTLSSNSLANEDVLTGTINFNEKTMETVASRLMGRVEKLYYRNIGDYVSKGAKLYDLYSEELNSAKQEYILLLQKKASLGNSIVDFSQLIQAAKNKLLLWGMTASQINDMEKTGQAPLQTTFYSTASGFITSLDVTEGAYVMAGQSLFKMANTSTVWAEAQVYTSQLSGLNRTAAVSVRLPDLGNTEVSGRIEFVNPEINPQTRLNLIRVAVPNPNNGLKPGMPAYIVLKNKRSNTTSLPVNAVIRNENMALVWLKSGPNRFRYQMVTTGVESGDYIEIKSGLNRGDTVVLSGAYLLNSEFTLRNGGSAMGNMKM